MNRSELLRVLAGLVEDGFITLGEAATVLQMYDRGKRENPKIWRLACTWWSYSNQTGRG